MTIIAAVPTTAPATQNGQNNGNGEQGEYCASAVESGRVASPAANAAEIAIRRIRMRLSQLGTPRAKTSDRCPKRGERMFTPSCRSELAAQKSATIGDAGSLHDALYLGRATAETGKPQSLLLGRAGRRRLNCYKG